MISSVVLKVADIDDLDSICYLDSEYEHEQYSIDSIRASLSDDKVITFIALEDKTPIGYVSYMYCCENADLIKIVVAKNYRGRGIGRLLMQESIIELQKMAISKIILEVRKTNKSAKVLYEKIGFKKIHERQKYYDDGEDADIYRLSLC